MTPEEREELLRRIREMEEEKKKIIESFTNSIPKIEFPIFDLPTIDFSVLQPQKFEIPKFVLPNFNFSVPVLPSFPFPKIELPEIDYERIKEITNDNSKFGWTLTGEMSLRDYLKDNMNGTSQEEKDTYFSNYYSKNDWEHFGYMKGEILEKIEPRWNDLIQECFDSFENDKYKLVIPTLFTIIEGEMSYVFQSHQGSYNLIQLIEKKAKNEESKMKQIALYSVVHSMQDQLFGSHKFYEERNELINRHWILHGRDEPSQWQKVDAIRLFNVISSLQFIKDILKDK